jgi:recombinational DNA repair ATPase RecF
MHYFKNFKGFAEAELDLSQNFTLLISPNGSGKSNLIEAIELFGFLAHGGPLYEITDLNKDSKVEIRGGLQSRTRYGENAFTLGFSIPIKTNHRTGTSIGE